MMTLCPEKRRPMGWCIQANFVRGKGYMGVSGALDGADELKDR